jgi:hypothetical protein
VIFVLTWTLSYIRMSWWKIWSMWYFYFTQCQCWGVRLFGMFCCIASLTAPYIPKKFSTFEACWCVTPATQCNIPEDKNFQIGNNIYTTIICFSCLVKNFCCLNNICILSIFIYLFIHPVCYIYSTWTGQTGLKTQKQCSITNNSQDLHTFS